jgi:hypothetical protein
VQPPPPFRLDELGTLQFERLCVELLGLDTGGFELRPWGLSLLVEEGMDVPGSGRLGGPTLVIVAWVRHGASAPGAPARLRELLLDSLAVWEERPARTLLVLTNVAAVLDTGVPATILGPDELWRLYAASPLVRLRAPAALGIADLGALVPEDAAQRSSADIAASVELAHVFVPTRAYHDALRALERHSFVVLTGPPEMGKTAIARMIGLAALTDGWEVHECIRPGELWSRFARDRRQVFVADDAFGSTEYRPEAAEHWAVELDRVLRAMDARHWLVWTSRPAPLKAGLRRIHREHGVERFPQPAEIDVDAARLDTGEKALILFRHAKTASLPEAAVTLVQAHGWRVVSHPHFTPERIRRFVAGPLRELTLQQAADLDTLVAAEIRRPTGAMAASYRALAPDDRAVLHALLDTPPGPVSERELLAAVRRHSPSGLAKHPAQIVDRLTDHFLRVVELSSVTWVHPSWRDLVIEELGRDAEARCAFVGVCGIHGIALALSTAGGEAGERSLPLLRHDGDWDAVADRLAELLPELEPPAVTLLLAALAEARVGAPDAARPELDALAAEVLAQLARLWSAPRSDVPVGLLAGWLALASSLPERPPLAALAAAWVDLTPSRPVDLTSASEATAFDDWAVLVELLRRHDPELLTRFGFPDAQSAQLEDYVASALRLAASDEELASRDTVVRTLRRLARLVPQLAGYAYEASARLELRMLERSSDAKAVPLRPLSPELEHLLAQPLVPRNPDERLVARVLRDL